MIVPKRFDLVICESKIDRKYAVEAF
jgi:hypothetical protein